MLRCWINWSTKSQFHLHPFHHHHHQKHKHHHHQQLSPSKMERKYQELAHLSTQAKDLLSSIGITGKFETGYVSACPFNFGCKTDESILLFHTNFNETAIPVVYSGTRVAVRCVPGYAIKGTILVRFHCQ